MIRRPANRRRSAAAAVLAFGAVAACPGGARGEIVWPEISLAPRASGLSAPVALAHAGDGSGRLFVAEQAGRVRIVRGGTLEPEPFLDISDRVLSGGERGLLGLAFPPGYAASGRFYLNYTRAPDGATVIARYRRSASDPDRADAASGEALLVISQPFPNHNGGQLAFGPDGYLYVGTGDGGSGGDPQNNAQNPESLLGKILRIDVESGAAPYAVPPTNPFSGTAGRRGEIWASGLRNPWRFSFDRETGDLYIADVGQDAREEVNFQSAASAGGENYGWNIMEGSLCFLSPGCAAQEFTAPVAEYDHSLGCSVTGGYVYRGTVYPSMRGIYFYGDFCSGRIFGLARDGPVWANAPLAVVPRSISTFGEDEEGNLFLADLTGGQLLEVVAGNAPPNAPALLLPDDDAGGLPSEVTFSWRPSADPEGDAVAYRFYLSTDPGFAGSSPVTVQGPSPDRGAARGSAVAVPAVALLLPFRRRRGNRGTRRPGTVLAALLLAALAWGCGGAGAPALAPPVTHTVSGLSPGTGYFWKVAATDGTGNAESPVRSFTTRPGP